MKLKDCEICHRHIRGHNVAIVFGAEPLSEAQLQQLMTEYLEIYGSFAITPAYVSPSGFQVPGREREGPLAGRFAFDEDAEEVRIDGNRFSAVVFEKLKVPTPEGRWLRVVDASGVVTIEERSVQQLQLEPDRVLVPAGDQATQDAEHAAAPAPAPQEKPAKVKGK